MRGIGERLRLARKQRRLTQQELARRVHTNQQTICDYETAKSGSFRPDIHLLFRICDELGVSIEWVLRGN